MVKYGAGILLTAGISLGMVSVISEAEHRWEPEIEAKVSPTARPILPPVSPIMPAVTETPLPAAVQLDIPFTGQAPTQNWELPYQEFCEEASMVMTAAYVNGETTLTPLDAEQRMLAVMEYENETLGYYKDTTAAETADILRNYYNMTNVSVVPNPDVVDIKRALADGKAVIVPAAGRMLKNPHFQQPGPIYHMFVINGYTTDDQFIAHDPGTRYGANYLYDTEIIMEAMHDWNDGAVETGQKVMITVGE